MPASYRLIAMSLRLIVPPTSRSGFFPVCCPTKTDIYEWTTSQCRIEERRFDQVLVSLGPALATRHRKYGHVIPWNASPAGIAHLPAVVNMVLIKLARLIEHALPAWHNEKTPPRSFFSGCPLAPRWLANRWRVAWASKRRNKIWLYTTRRWYGPSMHRFS